MCRSAVGLLALLALCNSNLTAALPRDGWSVAAPPIACKCTLESAPVCVKGKAYPNPCSAACEGYSEADWVVGECEPPIACKCTLVSAPVCVKGKTYPNPCSAACEGYSEADWVVGECAKSPMLSAFASLEPKCRCTKESNPVCYEGKTYHNRCLAECVGVTQWVAGACGKGRKCGCAKGKAPVCAKGKTFANPCQAKCVGYRKYTKGSCSKGPRSDCVCQEIYAPVCVTSIGKTFENACAANCAGHKKYTSGACVPPPIKCDAGSSTAKCAGDICETSESPCAQNPAVTCLINPCSSATYLGTKLKGLQCKPIYVNKTVLKVEKNCNKALPPLVCAPGSSTARCGDNPCESTTASCKGDARYVCLLNSCGTITYLGTPLTNAACTAIFVDPLTRKVAKQCITTRG